MICKKTQEMIRREREIEESYHRYAQEVARHINKPSLLQRFINWLRKS